MRPHLLWTLVLVALVACTSPPMLPSDSRYTLPAPSSIGTALRLRDSRPSSSTEPVSTDSARTLTDRNFEPLPLAFLQTGLAQELATHEWAKQSETWLGANPLALVKFEARTVRRSARPIDVASMSPAAGVILLGLSDLNRDSYAELSVTVASAEKRFEASVVGRMTGLGDPNVFIPLAEQVVRSLAKQIAEEAVGLSVPRRSSQPD